MAVSSFTNHFPFQTHERGGLLDPVLLDLLEETISYQQLGNLATCSRGYK